ncbi:MAG: AI-2E family transporter [Phycisphaerae bacterium]|nr:AI-2E family transporter [Phycisphaerae bacterium]
MSVRGVRDIARLARLLSVVVVIGLVWVAQDVLIPIALAVLFAFVLMPIATWIERRGAPRWVASVLTVGLATTLLVAAGWIVSTQVIAFAEALPQYRSHIRSKLTSLSGETDSWLSRARRSVFAMQQQVDEAAATLSGDSQPSDPNSTPGLDAGSPADDAVDVIAHESTSPTRRLAETVSAVTTPIVGSAIVLLFAIVILIRREDLRDRILALAGPDRIHTTTDMLDEAASQLSRLLLAQLLINIGFAIAFGAVLVVLGVPNGILFGASVVLLRFIPLVGAWVAVTVPTVVALLTLEGWFAPIVILGWFTVLEVITAYFIEPWALGRRTGMSITAVLLALVFWTWLWGPVGLVLAMPLTTSLAVMGRRMPALAWLGKLLNEDPGLPAPARMYQRLLSVDFDSALAVARATAETRGIDAAFGEVVLPALARLSEDRSDGQLSDERSRHVMDGIADIVDTLSEDWIVQHPPPQRVPATSVVCVPARDYRDELTARTIARGLACRGVTSSIVSCDSLLTERIAAAVTSDAEVVCICASPPLADRSARIAADRLAALGAQDSRVKRMIVALLHARDEDAATRLRARGHLVATTYDEAVRTLAG